MYKAYLRESMDYGIVKTTRDLCVGIFMDESTCRSRCKDVLRGFLDWGGVLGRDYNAGDYAVTTFQGTGVVQWRTLDATVRGLVYYTDSDGKITEIDERPI